MVGEVTKAPSIRTRIKSRHSELDEVRAIQRALEIWHGCQHPVPVIWGRKMLGLVKTLPCLTQTVFIPAASLSQGTPYPNIDTMVNKKTAGKDQKTYFFKPNSTSTVIDSWYDAWGTDGKPQKGDWSGSARTARSFTASTTGAMYTGGAVSPSLKYLTRASIFSGEGTIRSMIIYDRVLSYDASTMTAGSQSMTNTIPATRYITNGDPGLQIFIEADTVHNSTTGNLTVAHYTNNNGTTGQAVRTTPTLSKIVSIAAPTATLGARQVIATPGAATKGGNPYLVLQSGDQGVQKIEDYTWSAAPTGTNSYVLQFPLALFPDTMGKGQASDVEFINGIEFVNKQIFDDACLSILYAARVTAEPSIYHGYMSFGWT